MMWRGAVSLNSSLYARPIKTRRMWFLYRCMYVIRYFIAQRFVSACFTPSTTFILPVYSYANSACAVFAMDLFLQNTRRPLKSQGLRLHDKLSSHLSSFFSFWKHYHGDVDLPFRLSFWFLYIEAYAINKRLHIINMLVKSKKKKYI